MPELPDRLPAGEPLLSVAIGWDLDSLTLDPVGSADVHGDGHRTMSPAGWLRADLSEGAVRARSYRAGDEDWTLRLAARETLVVSGRDGSINDTRRAFVWRGKTWRGEARVFVNPRGKLTLVTRLPLETYLLGVVPYEIGQLGDDLIEAGRAQAVAARTYTLFYRGRRAAEGFDLYGTVEDQVYGSLEGEKPYASRCVLSTSGLVARWEGQPIRANYSSTCGGMMANVWEAWPVDPLPYLTSHADAPETVAGDSIAREAFCAASPHFRWREEWSAREILANLRKYGPTFSVPLPSGGLGQLLDVQVGERSSSGRVWRLTVTTTTGSVVIPAYSLRQVLRRGGKPDAILRSNLFKIDVRRDHRSGRSLAVVASGAGSGHGVGLCQTGALGMARAGYRGEDILRHYYRGVELKRLY